MPSLLFGSLKAMMFFAGVVWLQVCLSKRRKRIYGLLIPLVIFLYSLYLLMASSPFWLEDSLDSFFTLLLSLAFLNIPSLLFIGLYNWARKSREKENKDLLMK